MVECPDLAAEWRTDYGKQCGNRHVVGLLQGSKDMVLVAWMAGGTGVTSHDQNEGRTGGSC